MGREGGGRGEGEGGGRRGGRRWEGEGGEDVEEGEEGEGEKGKGEMKSRRERVRIQGKERRRSGRVARDAFSYEPGTARFSQAPQPG